jgi:hypothetical protein
MLLEHSHELVAAEPKTEGCDTATTEYYNDDDCNDDACITFFGFFRHGGNGHFIHDFFSL